MKLSSHKQQRETNIELKMTSMIDVVFLLLIFFVLTASFVKTEREIATSTKVDRKSAARAAQDLEIAIVDIVPRGDNFVWRIGTREIETVDELLTVLKGIENKSDGAFVRVPDECPFDMAAQAIQACKQAEFLGVSYVPVD